MDKLNKHNVVSWIYNGIKNKYIILSLMMCLWWTMASCDSSKWHDNIKIKMLTWWSKWSTIKILKPQWTHTREDLNLDESDIDERIPIWIVQITDSGDNKNLRYDFIEKYPISRSDYQSWEIVFQDKFIKVVYLWSWVAKDKD